MERDLVLLIWKALGDDVVTTSEATDRLEHLFNYRCPDDLAKTLVKMKNQGLLKGKVSFERGGWTWWTDDECRKKDVI